MNQNAEHHADSLDFIQSMLLQLNQMAKTERCDMLAYLIEMAYVECSDLARQHNVLSIDHHKRNSAA